MTDPKKAALLDRLRFMAAALRPGEGMLAFDREHRYLFWSEPMESISGLSAAEVLGKPAAQVFPFLVATGEISRFDEACQGRTAQSKSRPFSVPETRREGFFDAWYSPLRGEDRAIEGGIAIVQEVTERLRVDQRLRETENRFRNMADASPVLLWMSGTDALCTFFNKTWLAFTGRTMEQELGVGWAEGLHFEDFQRSMDTYLEAFNERCEFEMEYRLRRADGAFRVILDRGAPRYEPDGTFAGYIGSCVDITEHHELEHHLRQAVRDRDDFLSIASHELKTPLTALQLAVEILGRTANKSSLPVPAQFKKYVEKIDSQAARLGLLIDDLLDVSRLTAAGGRSTTLELSLEDVDLAQLVRQVAARLSDAVRSSGCAFTVDADEPVEGRWDRGRLERIVTNLISNALKYAVAKPVWISVRPSGETAVITVRDEGIGISVDDQARIFERFERGVSAKNYGGFGLGLWIARQLVEGHGGRITVESKLGEGATFEVTLPVAP